MKNDMKLICKDCTIEIFVDVNMVMLKDELWEKICDHLDDAICDKFIEKRMGRSILPKDFKDPVLHGIKIIPCNDMWMKNKINKQKISDNIIPEMTHPLSKGWSGPDRSEIQVDHQYARMNKGTFDRLQHIQGSSVYWVVYEGKMWKTSDDKIHWHLHWWSASDDPDKCKHNRREIIVHE